MINKLQTVKTNKHCIITISFDYALNYTVMNSFPKTSTEKKKKTWNMKVYCKIPLNYRMTGPPEDFKSNYLIIKKD